MTEEQQDLVCQECGKNFTFEPDDVAYFAKRGWPSPPSRCRPCRTAHSRTEKQAARTQEQSDVQPPFTTGDPNEYRSPMECKRPTAPRIRMAQPQSSAGESTPEEEDDRWARDPSAIGDPNEYRSPMQTVGDRPGGPRAGARRRVDRRPDRATEARTHAYHRDVFGNSSEYRSPMAGSFPAVQQASPGRGPVREGNSGPRSTDRKPQAGQRERRPVFTAPCAKCGAEAQVPFEPKPGRDIFCRACFAQQQTAPNRPASS